MIKMVPTYTTSDNKSHATPEAAINHERYIMMQTLLIARRNELGLPLTTVDKLAEVICKTHHEARIIFDADLAEGARNQMASGGTVKPINIPIFAQAIADREARRELPERPKTASPLNAPYGLMKVGDWVEPRPEEVAREPSLGEKFGSGPRRITEIVGSAVGVEGLPGWHFQRYALRVVAAPDTTGEDPFEELAGFMDSEDDKRPAGAGRV